nr:hypothetical protein [Spiroplasma endosymbiont of Phyllotreta cruciferae]
MLTVDQNQNIIVDPTLEQLNTGQMELIVAGTADAINMVEAGAKEVSETIMLEAISRGYKVIAELVSFQHEIIAKVGQPKMDVTLFTVRREIIDYVKEHYAAKLIAAAQIKEKVVRYETIQVLTEQALEHYPISKEMT